MIGRKEVDNNFKKKLLGVDSISYVHVTYFVNSMASLLHSSLS